MENTIKPTAKLAQATPSLESQRIKELESAIYKIRALAEYGEDSYYSAQNCCAAIVRITYEA